VTLHWGIHYVRGAMAEYQYQVARAAIDAGADMILGSHPHVLKAMEVYKGKPIFYSLGNFIGQNELVAKIPADGYERFRAEPDLTPGQVYQKRTQGDQAGFPADRRYWESVVPTLSYDGGELRSIELTPISLGWKDARHRRGRPRLAGAEEGRAILDRFAELSRPFGTEFANEARSVRLG
jgi:Bacterial capsule synthesis protein PGA_cap